jgi:hypothetical protein
MASLVDGPLLVLAPIHRPEQPEDAAPLDYRIEWANPAAAELAGLDVEELHDRLVFGLFPDLDATAWWTACAAALSSGRAQVATAATGHRAGRLQARAVPLGPSVALSLTRR